jgi:hypothetical protein
MEIVRKNEAGKVVSHAVMTVSEDGGTLDQVGTRYPPTGAPILTYGRAKRVGTMTAGQNPSPEPGNL